MLLEITVYRVFCQKVTECRILRRPVPAPNGACCWSFEPYFFLTFNQICEAATVRYQQWKDRQLRQRQRANYKRLWCHLPSICATLQLMALVVITELLKLPRSGEQGQRSNYIKYETLLLFSDNSELHVCISINSMNILESQSYR